MATSLRIGLLLVSLLLTQCRQAPPRSPLPYRAPVVVDWVWGGALRTDGIVLKARPAEDIDPRSVVMRVSRQADLREPVDVAAAPDAPGGVLVFQVAGLQASTRYYYAPVTGDLVEPARRGTFQTLPQNSSFLVTIGACARTASTAVIFDAVRRFAPLFFVHLGDFHYESVGSADPDVYRRIYDHVLASPAQSAMFRQVPVVYVWDDHDYGPDNSDALHPGRAAVRQVYQEIVPHYPLAAGSGDVAIYQSFEIGRVRFIATDCRSERSPRSAPDDASKTVLGARQKAWLKRELTRDRSAFPLVVWINTLPWIAPREAGADHWGGYSTERGEIADFLVRENVSGVAMLSGDAHMLAIDDGSHSDFSTAGGGGFPVFHTAALDRPGSVKGGPYSQGSFPGRGQVGLMRVEDRGGELAVTWSGVNWQGEELLRYEFSVSGGGPP